MGNCEDVLTEETIGAPIGTFFGNKATFKRGSQISGGFESILVKYCGIKNVENLYDAIEEHSK